MTSIESQLAHELAQSAVRSQQTGHYRETPSLHGSSIANLATPDAKTDFDQTVEKMHELLDQLANQSR